MHEPATSHSTRLGEVTPDDWADYSLADVCKLRRRHIDPALSGDSRYVGLEHIDSGNPRLGRYASATDVTSAKSGFLAGDILYGKLRPYLDKAVLAEWDGICSTDILVLATVENLVDPRFLVNLLHSSELLEHAVSTTSGVNHPRTSWVDLSKFRFACPPLTAQREIALVLSKIQASAEAQATIAERARELKRALMARLFTEGLYGDDHKETEIGPVPTTWDIVKLGDRVKVQSGGTPSRSNPTYWGGTIPWVKTGEIDYNIIAQTEECITPAGLANSSARLCPAGTLLMAMYGQGVTRGRVAILGIEAATNQACAALFPDSTLTTPYLFTYLTYAYERVRNFAHGAQQKNLSGEIIKALKIPAPPSDQQQEIARIIGAVDSRILAAERKRAGLGELFQTLLQELMTGRVRVSGVPT